MVFSSIRELVDIVKKTLELGAQGVEEYLRKFTLVFFDDILIYSKSLKDHVIHLTVVLAKIKDHNLYTKESKCVFGTTHVEYIGHVISAAGVATDLSKIQAMKSWPIPNNIKKLRGFLGLTGYYRIFIKNFALITLPNFNKPFVVETDASGVGLGAVLQQDGHPIAYMNHYSLKYLLDQKITTPTQIKWLPKLMVFDYEVVYKQGKDNGADDAYLGEQIWSEDEQLQNITLDLKEGEVKKHYVLLNNQLLRKGKLVVGRNETLRKDLLSYFHDGAIGGHSGVEDTSHKICAIFYWKCLRKQVKTFVKECLVCQKCKPDLSAYPGLLQPLPIPKTVWSSISMDFIEGLPKSHGCTVILVVVDRLTKYVHFIPLSHSFTALQVAQVFLDQIPLAELWYNSNYHSAIDTTPFEALYGQPPPVYVPYIGGLSKVDAVERSLIAREQAIKVMKFHLSRAQNRMKQQADKNRSEREFEVGNWVLLKLQPQGKQNKFSPKYFGPFEMLAKVGKVAYKLKLPNGSQIHDVFHVSQLKKVYGSHQGHMPTVFP
ncbi:retrotransposon-related protein [Tanacetum coccineum]